ncbi:hypothetical protein FKM82_024787 [Ascaphus truei]
MFLNAFSRPGSDIWMGQACPKLHSSKTSSLSMFLNAFSSPSSEIWKDHPTFGWDSRVPSYTVPRPRVVLCF